AYVPESRLLKQREAEATESPDSALAQYRLGVAESEAGLDSEAIKDLARAESLAKPDERFHGIPLRDLARETRHAALLTAADRAEKSDSVDAIPFFERASDNEFAPTARVQALNRLASLCTKVGRRADASSIWQRILDDPILRQCKIVTGERLNQPAR